MSLLLVMFRLVDAFPFQNILAVHILASSFPRRKWFWPRVFLHALPAMLIYDFTMQVHPENLIPNPVLDKCLLMVPLLYAFFGLLFCYECSFTGAVFCGSCASIIVNFFLQLWYILKVKLGFHDGMPISALCSLGPLVLGCIVFYFFFAREINERKWSPFVQKIILLMAFLFLALQTFFNDRVPAARWEYNVYVTYMIADVAILAVQVVLSAHSILEEKYEVIEELLQSEYKRQRMSAENIALINRKCHDLKHQIEALRQMGNASEREAYIREIESAVLFYGSSIKTGNPTLDLIMMEKLLYCQEHDIKLTCLADAGKLSCMDTMDLYALFGNAIENAIEHVRQEPEHDRRIICMRIGSWGGYLTIHIENYLAHELTLSNGLPMTTKEDKHYHGFGVLSIRHTVEKYHGEMHIRTDDHLFQLDILIPAT